MADIVTECLLSVTTVVSKVTSGAMSIVEGRPLLRWKWSRQGVSKKSGKSSWHPFPRQGFAPVYRTQRSVYPVSGS
jgi:hypothetical protein